MLSCTTPASAASPHLVEVALGEKDAHVANHVVQQLQPLVVASALAVQADAATHHGVLAHQNHRMLADSLHRRWGNSKGQHIGEQCKQGQKRSVFAAAAAAGGANCISTPGSVA
jgi:hypothetical protein